jgi:kynurenine formamidase
MKIIDLTRLLDPADLEKLPEWARPAVNLIPQIYYQNPKGEGADVMCSIFGCTREDLPDGEGWGDEQLKVTTHLGTHVDAPLHYGTMCEGKPSRTITDIDLSELYCDGFVLDLRGLCSPGESITVDALKQAVDALDAEITPGCALLLRTGQEKYSLGDLELFNYPGMRRDGTLYLANLGAKVLGTDALGWDRPFLVMRREFKATGDASVIWDGHFAGREKEVFIVQQVDNLAALPPKGFKVGCFPLRLAGCSASPARVVAFLD